MAAQHKSHEIRNPKRVASPSLAGHRFGFWCIVSEWLGLSLSSHLVVEGNEDADLVETTANLTRHTEIQYRKHSSSFGPKNKMVYGTLAHFIDAWCRHKSRGHQFRGVLHTTAEFVDRRSTPLGTWIRGGDATVAHKPLLSLLEEHDVAHELIDAISTLPTFQAFASTIVWRTGREDEERVQRRIEAQLRQLVPDLDAHLAARTLVDEVARRASSSLTEDRLLTMESLWRCLNRATIDALAQGRRAHAVQWLTASAKIGQFRCACVLVGDISWLQDICATASSWATLLSSDASLIGAEADFVCYAAVVSGDVTSRNARRAVMRQATVSSALDDVNRATGLPADAGTNVASQIAQRCIAFQVSRNPSDIAPFITKIRWLRLQDGRILTANDLLR